jgi:Uma2 family endonuclease
MTIQLLRKKFTIEEFQLMADSGIIPEDERVELIEGEIIEMGKIGRRHAAIVRRLISLLTQKLGNFAIIDAQNPIELGIYSQPQPDISLLRRRDDYYESGHPKPEDIFLLIEVADSSLEFDREIKIPLYWKSNITEVWIVDINNQLLEVYRQPNSEGYQSKQTYQKGDMISPLAFANTQIAVTNIFE